MAHTLRTTLLFLSLSFPALAQEEPLIASSTELLTAPQPMPVETPPPADPDKIYHLNLYTDIPVTAVGAGWSAFAFQKIYDKSNSSVEDIRKLNKNDLNGLDRWAAGMHSESATAASDYLFYGSMPLPFILLVDKKVRKEAPKVGFMYLEAMAVTGLLYTGCDYFIDRYRPETYRTDVPAEELTSGNNRNSFFAGHVALVGTSTFFMAKIYNDYHPQSGFRYAMWGFAIAATGTTAYLRHKGGKHFPTDIAVGTAIGVLSGVLIPELHKNKKLKAQGWSLSPAVTPDGAYGVSLRYRFK